METLSAGVVIARLGDGEPHYLLLRAYNYWDFPKGEVEQGEDPLATAIREVKEETGLADLSFCWGTAFRETPKYGRGKVARYYVAQWKDGEVSLPVNPELGRPEHHEFRWLSHTEAHALLNDRLKPILQWANQRVRHPNGRY